MHKYLRAVVFVLLLGLWGIPSMWGQTDYKKSVISGEPWQDTSGDTINAHGGGVIYHNGTYYWFGDRKSVV